MDRSDSSNSRAVAGGGAGRHRLDNSASPVDLSGVRRRLSAATLSDDEKHAAAASAAACAAEIDDSPHEDAFDSPRDDEDDSDLINQVLSILESLGLRHFSKLVFCMNALFMQQNVLTEASFGEKEILRFFRLIIKVFSPKPPKRSKVPKKPNRPKQDESGSTSRLEILMKIWKRTGIQNFVCDAKKIIRGIFLATANPMLVNLVITAIQSVESFAEPQMKRMCLFLIALAAGISCDSPIVKEPRFLACFFDKVFDAISDGMDESKFAFDRATVLPPDDFPQDFADVAWGVLDYVNSMFAQVLNSAPAESSRKPAAKKQQEASAADANPFKDFDTEILDSATIVSNACSTIDAGGLPVSIQHSFHCFYHALALLETQDQDIMGLTTEHSSEFVLLSLLHAPMQPIPSIAFMQFGSLLSMIEKVGATKFSITHEKSADFLSKFACLVRLLRPEGDQAQEFLASCFTADMRAFASRASSISSVMTALYGLFRKELVENKRRVLDQQFNAVFPSVKLEEIKASTKERVKFPAEGGGEAAEDEPIAVTFRDCNLRDYQRFVREQKQFEEYLRAKEAAEDAKKEKK